MCYLIGVGQQRFEQACHISRAVLSWLCWLLRWSGCCKAPLAKCGAALKACAGRHAAKSGVLQAAAAARAGMHHQLLAEPVVDVVGLLQTACVRSAECRCSC